MGLELLTTRDVVGRYFLALEQAVPAPWVDMVSSRFGSDQASETYPFLGQAPQLREWVGGRHAKGFRDNSLTVLNKHYEATIDILLRHMRRDKTGQVDARVGELADRSLSHWPSLLSTLIINGASTACYDGEFFFDTDHSEGDSGSQSNDISADISEYPVETAGTTTNPSVEEMQFAINEGITQIMGFLDDQGEPMNETAREFLVMVPLALRKQALSAVALPSQITSSQSGMNDDNLVIRVASNPRLDSEGSWTDQFAIFRTDGRVKSLIAQEETAPDVKVKGPESEYAFDNDAIQVGVDTWRNVAYGFWQYSCLVTLV